MNVVSNERVINQQVSNQRISTQQVSNGCSLKWMWSLKNESQTNRYLMDAVSDECGL